MKKCIIFAFLWVIVVGFSHAQNAADSTAQNPDSIFARAGRKYEAGDNHGALILYNQLLELKPDYIEALVMRGNVLKGIRDFTGALKDYNKALSLNPNDAEAFYNRGNVHYELKEDREALADYNKAIELKPDFAIAYFNRGLVHLALRDKASACTDLRKAAEVGYTRAYTVIDKYCGQ